MRRATVILSVLTVFILLIAVAAEATDTVELEAKIRKIKSCLERPGGPGPDGEMMFTWLLEAILQAAPDTSYPPEFADNIEKTKDHTDAKSLFNPDGFVYLNKAYRLINDGSDYRLPDSISDIRDIVNYASMKLASARENLKPYKIDLEACVKDLVCVAVMIMAPRHKSPSQAADARGDLKVRIQEAADTLTGPPGPAVTKEMIVAAILELLDAAAVLTPDNQYRKEIEERIRVAEDLIRKDSPFNDKARQYLSFAYRMMTAGRKFEIPEELGVFVTTKEFQVNVRSYAQNMIAKALESLEAGDGGESARILLELVLMTITPVAG